MRKYEEFKDGITVLVKRNDYDKCIVVSEDLMKQTSMSYEANVYSKMVLMDVNNYVAQYKSGECKYKGLFEIDKEFHKDNSMRIVPIALSEYFINKVPIKETILNHKNIYDFCLRLRVTKGWEAQYHYFDDGIKIKSLSKTTRYFISNNGGSLYKKHDDGRLHGVNIGQVATLFNKFYESNDYNINFNYYISECNKIIDQIENKQLTLF